MQSTWEAHKSSAEKAESLGRLAQAEAHWYAALEDAQAAFSMTDPRTTSTLECLSENLFRQSKYNLAVPVVAKSLEIFQFSLGPNHADVGILLNNLGMLHHLQNDFAEAEKFYQRSMTVLTKALGPGHPELANLLANYSDLLVRTDRTAEANQLRRMLKGLNTGRWTRVVVHESYRPQEEDPEDCVTELGLEYQHRASEVRLKMVQDRIKDAAQKQQERVPDRTAKPEQKGLMSQLRDPAANPQKDSASGSGKRSISLAKPDEQANRQQTVAAAKDANTAPQFEHLSLTDPSEEKLPPGIVRILASRMNKRDMT